MCQMWPQMWGPSTAQERDVSLSLWVAPNVPNVFALRSDDIGIKSVDPTEALIGRNNIAPHERGVQVRHAAQFGPGVGLNPVQEYWARYNLGLARGLLPSGGTWQPVESSCDPVPLPVRLQLPSGRTGPYRSERRGTDGAPPRSCTRRWTGITSTGGVTKKSGENPRSTRSGV